MRVVGQQIAGMICAALIAAGGLLAAEKSPGEAGDTSDALEAIAPLKKAPETAAEWALKTYGETIEFTVHRNGDAIGTHLVTLSKDGEDITIESRTKLRVKFLFFTAYKLDYQAREQWTEEGLERVFSKTQDGKKLTTFDRRADALDTLLPTNHWNPHVVTLDQIYNTITGNVMAVTITPKGLETVETASGDIAAYRFDYSGDLKDVSVWYDGKGRWVSLQFKGRDGSTIRYQCRKCGL